MKYFLKVIGFRTAKKSLLVQCEEGDSCFWEDKCKVWFPKKARVSVGDVLIQYALSTNKNENHRIVGYYECISEIKQAGKKEPHPKTKTREWLFYVNARNLNREFSKMQKKDSYYIGSIKEVLAKYGFERIPVYGGYGAIEPKMAIGIINSINTTEKLMVPKK